MSDAVGGLRIVSDAELDRLNFAKGGGLVTVVAQDHLSGAVLMVAHAGRDALAQTLISRKWSRVLLLVGPNGSNAVSTTSLSSKKHWTREHKQNALT
jgi:phosphoribosyl-ATP pyrophosphohydrolase/phosphoribosyl-AMP cyclohydrolase